MALNCDLPPDVKIVGPNVVNVHQRFVVVKTKTAAEVKAQNGAEAAAIKTAEAAVASAPVSWRANYQELPAPLRRRIVARHRRVAV
jgi:hypothetical protein